MHLIDIFIIFNPLKVIEMKKNILRIVLVSFVFTLGICLYVGNKSINTNKSTVVTEDFTSKDINTILEGQNNSKNPIEYQTSKPKSIEKTNVVSKESVLVLNDSVEQLRDKYVVYLKNHPFAKTKNLPKSERKAMGIPPNAYFEQEWLYSSNPNLGRPEPEVVFQLQTELEKQEILNRTPGDGLDNQWVERGPNNVGGRTRALIFAPGSTIKVFAGSVSGGLWVNNDITSSTSSWTEVNGVPGNLAVSSITVDPNNSSIMYVGTGEIYTGGDVNGNGVYKSTDGGTNWINIYGAATSTNVSDNITYIQDIIAWNNPTTNLTEVYFGVDAYVYGQQVIAGAGGWAWLGLNRIGLYKSTDGVNFNRLEDAILKNASNRHYAPNTFDVGADGKLWMGTKYCAPYGVAGGMIFSTSNGTTWNNIRDFGTNGRVEVVASKQNAGRLYVLLENRTGGGLPTIRRTTDGFATNNVTVALPVSTGNQPPAANDFCRGQAFYDLMIGLSPSDDNEVYVGGIEIFKTTSAFTANAASMWTQYTDWTVTPTANGSTSTTRDGVHSDHHCMAFAPGLTSRVVFGCDGGIYYSNDSANSIGVRNKDYITTQFVKSGINQTGVTQKLVAGAQDNGTQFINNAPAAAGSSSTIAGGDGFYCFVDKQDSFMISSYVYNVYRRHDMTGANNTDTGYPFAYNQADGDFVNQCDLDSDADILYANGTNGATYRIYRYTSLSTGCTWNGSAYVGGAPRTTLSNALLNNVPTAFKASPHTINRLLVGVANGRLLRLNNANGTPTWSSIGDGSWIGAVSDIRYGATENDIFVTFHNYGVPSVWYTANGNAATPTWQNKEGDLPNIPVKCIMQNPFALNEVIIGTELGVWATTNFNAVSPNWARSNNGMKDVKVMSFDYRSVDNTILAATYGRGMFTGEFWTCGSSTTIWNGTAWSNGNPDKKKVAVIDGNYNTTADGSFTCCSLQVNNLRALTITANNYVTVSGDITVTGTLNVLNDGSLVQIDDAAINTGNISYERTTTGTALDYVYWSSPVDGVNTPSTGFIFTWDPSFANPNTGWGYWLYARNTTMSAGVGYIMQDVFSRTFTGVPRNGVIQPTVSRANYTGADFTGTNGVTITKFDDNWNLIGNPYPSSISALDFLTMNTNIEGAVRLWTHDTSPSTAISDPFYANYVSNYTVNDYITHNGTGTVSGPAGFNGYIAGGQSFFVNMLDGSASTQPITFNNSLRNEGYDNSQFYRQAEPIRDLASQKSRIWLDIVDSNNVSDRTLIGYVDGATYGNDRMFDAVTNVLSGMKIYSIINNNRMTINGRSLPFENQDKVQLGVKTTTGGMFSIAISAVDGLFVNQAQGIFLEDKELNIIHNLRQSAYSFYMPTKGELNERFVLRYTDERLSVDEIAIIDNTVLVISGDVLEVISNKETLQEIVVYDVLGRKIFSKKNINSKNIELPQIQKSNNTLFVNITLENNSKIIKKVIF